MTRLHSSLTESVYCCYLKGNNQLQIRPYSEQIISKPKLNQNKIAVHIQLS